MWEQWPREARSSFAHLIPNAKQGCKLVTKRADGYAVGPSMLVIRYFCRGERGGLDYEQHYSL